MAAEKNLFEKYGIKEVADVTFYRIDRQKETYESQRKITAASILKGAVELKTVYPNDGTGVGAEEGFEAYVFTDAELLTHTNYNCDDNVALEYKATVVLTGQTDATMTKKNVFDSLSAVKTYTKNGKKISVQDVPSELIEKFNTSVVNGVASKDKYDYKIEESYSTTGDGTPITSGTHEYSYPEQVLMLYAKNQNLLTRAGARYHFDGADTYFGDIEFNDNFFETPGSDSKMVVVGLAGKFTENLYDAEDVMTTISSLTATITAKAYDVQYSDYAELIVEDEMGYFNPAYLGGSYTKRAEGSGEVDFFTSDNTYTAWAEKLSGVDQAIANSEMWGKAEHDSINDAIDALKQKKLVIDNESENGLKGILKIHGGYKVNDKYSGNVAPEAGKADTEYEENKYNYSAGDNVTSNYSLQSVLDALTKLTYTNEEVINDLAVTTTDGKSSNRAIYVRVNGEMDMAAGAFLYILTNKNSKKLSSDKDGIFYFVDKKGNTVYYQDKIFAGVEHLALVVIGKKGLIFVTNRCGYRKTDAIGWVVSRKGYPSDEHCERIVENGLIHTIPVTVNDETFEATCTVSKLAIRKIKKNVLHYTPVLFLDTLKVSTIEQTAEEVYATGGKGNANLIGWDYGKNITLTLQDALYTPASMSAMLGNEGTNFVNGVKDTKHIDRMEKVIAKRSFIVPAGNSKGLPSEGDMTAQAVFIDPSTMKPYQDGTPIAEGELFLKWTRSIAYENNSIGNTIEISAEKFPGTYKVVGDTFARSKTTGEDERFMFIIPQAKMGSEVTITLEAEGDPTVFDMSLTVLRPDDGIMMKLVQYDVVDNTEENDGSTMVKDTENLNLLDDAEMFKVNADSEDDTTYIGATEY